MQLSRRTVIAGLMLSGCSARTLRPGALIFAARDDVAVSGRIYGRGPRGLVLVPGGHGVGETWDLQARRLARAGFRVLAMDYRGRGESPHARPDDDKVPLDVLGAAHRLRAEGARTVAVVGASWGGWAAATAAIAEPGSIDRLVLLAHSPFDEPEKLLGPKLFIVAEQDRDGSGAPRLTSIREQYERTPEPKELLVLPGSAHAQFLFLTPSGERLYAAIEKFLSAR